MFSKLGSQYLGPTVEAPFRLVKQHWTRIILIRPPKKSPLESRT